MGGATKPVQPLSVPWSPWSTTRKPNEEAWRCSERPSPKQNNTTKKKQDASEKNPVQKPGFQPFQCCSVRLIGLGFYNWLKVLAFTAGFQVVSSPLVLAGLTAGWLVVFI